MGFADYVGYASLRLRSAKTMLCQGRRGRRIYHEIQCKVSEIQSQLRSLWRLSLLLCRELKAGLKPGVTYEIVTVMSTPNDDHLSQSPAGNRQRSARRPGRLHCPSLLHEPQLQTSVSWSPPLCSWNLHQLQTAWNMPSGGKSFDQLQIVYKAFSAG